VLQLPRRRSRQLALLALAGFFIVAGSNHFLNPGFYVRIMPPYLPAHLELVYLSGLFEVLGGIAVLFQRLRAMAGWCLILLLVAIYPANLHMAFHPELFPEVPSAALYARLPLQLVFVAWAYWATRPESAGRRREMADSAVSGACLCGAVRFRVHLPSLFCGHCHCSMCRRNHGAAFVTWFAVPPTQLEVHAGNRELRRYSSSTHGTRIFCGRCGSSLFCESDKHPDQVDIALANVEDPIDRAPQFHFYFDSRAPWAAVDDDLPRLGGPTGMEPLDPEEAV
jgi:uncharacterized membrane protein